jgi:outer membrane protein insertion porin family
MSNGRGMRFSARRKAGTSQLPVGWAAKRKRQGALLIMKLFVRVLRGVGVAAFILGGTILGGAVGSIATAENAAAQQIVVQGNRRVEASTIQSYFRLNQGERLDDVKIDNAYKALIGTGLFQDVQIRRAGPQIIVTVVESPVINRVAFEGNKRVKDEILTGEVQSKPRGTFSRAIVQSDVQRILEV